MNMPSIGPKLLTCIIPSLKHFAGSIENLVWLMFAVYCSLISILINICHVGRAECSCNPVRLFAILSMQRSGSGWFETLLNSHVNASSNGEIFSVKGRRENASSITKTLDRVYNLDWFTSASKNQCSAAVGFKWMLNQVNFFLYFGPI